VRLRVSGLEVEARIDTGGELLTLSPDVAEAIGVHAVVSPEGVFAAGARGRIAYGPSSGPGSCASSSPRSTTPAAGSSCVRARATRLPVSRFRSGSPPLTFCSPGARSSSGSRSRSSSTPASRTKTGPPSPCRAPPSTFSASPLRPSPRRWGESGAGRLSHRYGRFPVRRVGLGRLVQDEATGLYGIFPDEWVELDGIRIHGIISHGFLRRYAWTLDFERMTMTFAT
jgi:hypothetical protein